MNFKEGVKNVNSSAYLFMFKLIERRLKKENKMRKLFSFLAATLLILSILPIVTPAGTGGSLGGSVGVEEFDPLVFQCGDRVLTDDDVQPWRTSSRSEQLFERNQQYLFDGERYQTNILVFDKNKIEDDMVDLVLEGEQVCSTECIDGECVDVCEDFDDVVINCIETTFSDNQFEYCNARIQEEKLTEFDPQTMRAYTCNIDVLDSEHMYGLYWLKVRATSALTDAEGEYDEIARWYINPIISLSVSGDLDFSDLRPGTSSYSTVLIENSAEGGVLLDMFITGDNWPSATSELARCQNVDGNGNKVGGYVNYLPLGAFRYYAENGAFSTRNDMQIDNGDYSSSITRNRDLEGYMNIHRQLNAGFEESMFDEAEVIQANPVALPAGSLASNAYLANLLYPGSAGMSVTFRLNLPEPCYGEFESESDGSIFFWGEAI